MSADTAQAHLPANPISSMPEAENACSDDPCAGSTDNNSVHSPPTVSAMLDSCSSGSLPAVLAILDSDSTAGNLAASRQDEETGKSPLMAAAEAGHLEICRLLLERGAPWNAIDRNGRCAGNYATDAERWDVVNLLVDAGTRAELILGASARLAMGKSSSGGRGYGVANENRAGAADDGEADKAGESSAKGAAAATAEKASSSDGSRALEHEPCTKPDYLSRSVRYNAADTALLDDDGDAVMMEWERPLMKAHASVITSSAKGKRVMNVGFGMGIIDTFLQEEWEPRLHIIVEAHPAVHARMVRDGWDKKSGVRVCFGRWQDAVPKLIEEGIELDGIFYDTYGEHHTDLEDFQDLVAKLLAKPDGVYSFFNGLAPDNLFFHGVACNCVKLQLAHLGLDAEFAPCEVQVKEKDWEGVRRKYWHGRETYYLPVVAWNQERLRAPREGTKEVAAPENAGEGWQENKKLKIEH